MSDAIARRTAVVTSGLAFGGAGNERFTTWGYDARNELTSSHRYLGDDPNSADPNDPNMVVADEQFTYDYDPIGNRAQHSDYDGGTRDWEYNTNELNQYYQVLTDDAVNGDVAQGYRFDDDGNLIEGFVAGDADGGVYVC